jgi:hypothetical protein
MGPDKLQLQRVELKYRVREAIALEVRGFVQSFLELDEYGVGRPGLSYPIHSLYLDSDDLRTFRETFNGSKNRFKLRLRFYDDRPSSPVFFEIKRRQNDAILKQRAGVRRAAVNWLLAGQLPEPKHLLSSRPDQQVALQNFCRLMLDLQARPKVHVAYLREAWVSTQDNSVRVTMDREVCVARQFGAGLELAQDNPVRPFGTAVILELKFTGRFPNWFRELVQRFDLERTSAAKYGDGVALIGEEHLIGSRPVPVDAPPSPAPVEATAEEVLPPPVSQIVPA